MSQRDLVAELQAARLTAPPELRERVRLIAADASEPPPRFTWRRALVVVLPVAAAIAATVVFTRPSHERTAVATETLAAHGTVRAAVPAPTTGAATKEFTVPSDNGRVQQYGATLSLRIPTPTGVSNAVKRALRITASLGGYSTSVHANSYGKSASAELTLKVPRTHVQEAMARLSQLGTITSEQVDVLDQQAGLNAIDREIARLQKKLAALRALPPSDATKVRIAQLTARIEALQRSEAATRRAAHYATIQLSMTTAEPVAPPTHHRHGPLHGVVVALTWLGIGAVYALAIGLPVLAVLLLVYLAIRTARRRREDALLNRS
jgi:Domain of unknown function (DUF4349)